MILLQQGKASSADLAAAPEKPAGQEMKEARAHKRRSAREAQVIERRRVAAQPLGPHRPGPGWRADGAAYGSLDGQRASE